MVVTVHPGVNSISSLRAEMWTLDPLLNLAHVLLGSKAKRRLRF
jgi:hypothetical protein